MKNIITAFLFCFLIAFSAAPSAMATTITGTGYSYTIDATTNLTGKPTVADLTQADVVIDTYNTSTTNNVLTIGTSKAGYADFTAVSGTISSFAFTWGDISSYQSIELYSTGHYLTTITISDLATLLGPSTAVLTNTTPNVYISLTGLTGVDEIVLSTIKNSKMTVTGLTISTSTVPLPAALPLFGAGLLALAGIKRTKRGYKTPQA